LLGVTTPLALTLARFYRRVPPREFSWVSRRDPWQDVIEFAATSPPGRRRFRDEGRRGERPRVMRKSQSPRRCPGEKSSLRCISGTSSRGNSLEHLVASGIAFNPFPLRFSRETRLELFPIAIPRLIVAKHARHHFLFSASTYNKIIITSRAFKYVARNFRFIVCYVNFDAGGDNCGLRAICTYRIMLHNTEKICIEC